MLTIPVTINLYSVVIAVFDNDDIVSLKTLKAVSLIRNKTQ
ncbi:MAG: hypothetical protein ABFD10_04030 [Prolixibacteraceae bacterium]